MAITTPQWSQSLMPHSQSTNSSLQTLACAITSLQAASNKRNNDVLVCRYFHRFDRSSSSSSSSSSAPPATSTTKLFRHRSCEIPKPSVSTGCRTSTIRRACSASLDAFSDEEFSKKIQELAVKLDLSDDGNQNTSSSSKRAEAFTRNNHRRSNSSAASSSSSSPIIASMELEIDREPPQWPGREDMLIERKANSVDLPLSLRIIKKKKQQTQRRQEEDQGAKHSSVNKAFSSMFFIIRELHSYTLQLREFIFYENLQGVLARVQNEIQASFVWLFQQVFSHTPSLMLSLMILLANFSVHSMSANSVTFDRGPDLVETVAPASQDEDEVQPEFHSSAVKSFSPSSSVAAGSGGRTSAVGGEGGGGRVRRVANGAEGEGWRDGSGYLRRSTVPTGDGEEEQSVSKLQEEADLEQESKLWNEMLEEASRMQAEGRDESLMDLGTILQLVSPVTAESFESDGGYEEFARTELLYQTSLAKEPNNPLLLANYAQFLYLVARDYDRAEKYFKKATSVEPKDGEAYNKYATFLWLVRKDLWAAEETYLEAISAEPSNTFYASSYAHFLWNTGGEDTCYPLDDDWSEVDNTGDYGLA